MIVIVIVVMIIVRLHSWSFGIVTLGFVWLCRQIGQNLRRFVRLDQRHAQRPALMI